MSIYLDYNATAPLWPKVKATLIEAMEIYGNPASAHHIGQKAKAAIEKTRHQLAQYLYVSPGQIYFTSGATEAINTVIKSFSGTILTLATEHKAVLEAAGPNRVTIPVTSEGGIDLEDYEELLQTIQGPKLVCVAHAQSEIGTLQPLDKVIALAHRYGALIHCDAVQTVGRMPINWAELPVDYLSLSAHKFGGPKGVGAFYMRPGLSVSPLISGGGQEHNIRSGTENMLGIIGMGVALQEAIDHQERFLSLNMLRDRFADALRQRRSDCIIFGENHPRLPNTLYYAFPGILASTQLMSLDLAKIAVSSTSACSSGKSATPYALLALGASLELAQCAIRISLGWESSEKDLQAYLTETDRILKRHTT